ncbi:hypothetical protein Ndes2526B_g07162 [Nannochloris sp. 'desiccata']
MSKIVETALSGLREIGLEKLAKLDSICDSHLAWLAAAVGDVKRQIAETGHVAKKRRVGVDSVDNIVEESGKAVGANERRARREPKPAAKVTRAKRGKKAKTEPVEETIAAPVEPIEDEPSGSQPVVAIAHVEEKPAPAKRATRRTKAAEPAAAVDIPFAPAEKPEAASTRKEEKQPVPETSRPKRGCGAKKGAAVVTKESPAVAVAPKPEPEVVPAPAAAVEEPVQEAPPVPATKRGGRKPATKSKAPAKKAATKATKPPARQQRARRGKTPAAPEEPEEVAAAPVAQQEPEVKEKLISQLPDESFMVDLSMPATQETRQKSVAQVIEKPASIEKEDETHPEAMEVEKVSNVAEAESSPLAAKNKIRGFSPAAAEALVVEEEEEEAIVVAAAPVAAAIPAESNETATPASIRDASNVQETAGVKVEQPVLETTQLEKLEQLPEFEDDEEDMVDAVSMPAPEEEEQEDPHSPAEHVAEVDVVIREEKEEPAQKTSPIAAAADDEDEDVEEPTAAVMENGQDGVENIDEEEEEEAAGPSDGAKEHEQQGLAANLVSTIRSFLPTSKPASPAHAAKPKKHPKVKALEAAEAAAAEAEAARTREEARLKREEEAAQRRKDREELEKREREEKARRLEMLKQKRKEEAAAAAAAAAAARAGAESRPAVASTSAANSLAEAKERLAKIQQQTALLAQQATKPSTSVGASLQPTRLLEPGSAAVVAAPRAAPAHAAAVPLAPSTSQRIGSSNEEAAGPQTYEISPYRSDFESDDDEPKKTSPRVGSWKSSGYATGSTNVH